MERERGKKKRSQTTLFLAFHTFPACFPTNPSFCDVCGGGGVCVLRQNGKKTKKVKKRKKMRKEGKIAARPAT